MSNQQTEKYAIIQHSQDFENGRAYKKAILNGGKIKIYRFIYLGPTNDEISGTMFNYVPIKQEKTQVTKNVKDKGDKKTCSYEDLFKNAIIFKGYIDDNKLKEMLTFVN